MAKWNTDTTPVSTKGEEFAREIDQPYLQALASIDRGAGMTGCEGGALVALMRSHKVSITTLAARLNVSTAEVRRRRAHGIRDGLFLLDWYESTTGHVDGFKAWRVEVLGEKKAADNLWWGGLR